LTPVIKVLLAAQRDAQLLGISDASYSDELKDLGDAFLKFYYHLKHKMIEEKDYSQIANIPLMLSLIGQSQLLENNYVLNFNTELDELRNFCHFKLTVDMDIKVGRDGGYVLTHLKGTAKVVTELDSVKCLKFVLDKEEQAKIKLDVIANEIIAPGPHPVYIGSKIGESPMPFIDIHFCDEGNDSIYVFRSVPKGGNGMWRNPGGPPLNIWINSLDAQFQDSKQLAADAEAAASDYKNDPSKIDAMKQEANAMQAKLAAMRQSGKSPAMMAEEIKKMMDKGEKATQQPVVRLSQLKFPVKLFNYNKVLINERFDAKQINPDAAPVIVYGYLTIKLEHDPKK